MRKLCAGIFAGTLLCGLSLAQGTTNPPSAGALKPAQQSSTQSAQPSAPATGTPRIAPGSVIPVELMKAVDAKKAKVGDAVEARVTQDLKANNGELVVPKDTKVVGHVTEAQARTKEQKESQVGIAFDHAVLKDGQDMSLPMSIQAIIAPEALTGGNGNSQTPPEQQPQPPDAGGAPTAGGGRSGMGMGSGMSTPRMPNPSTAGGDIPSNPTGSSPHPSITTNTQGVVGMPNIKLSTAGEANQGSVVSSEKNNVKLETGTLMLLRVNQ
jgi:hypothetical protein